MAGRWLRKCCMLLGSLALLGQAGCSLLEIWEQAQITSTIGIIEGKIVLSPGLQRKGPIEVRQFFYEDGAYVYSSYAMENAAGEYQFLSLPGTYYTVGKS